MRKKRSNKKLSAKKISKKQHGINRDDFSKNALEVAEKIRKNKYVAYIVGGAVRDSLLGIKPKDFDIATDATPAQVRRLFSRSRIIGRRFRIVHLYFNKKNKSEIIEVSTFRAGDDDVCEESGRILRDNIFGGAASDAWRRDFCMNALFYDPHSENIVDYVGGYADIRHRRLRVIGEPLVRFRQDPVRILRALRFSAHLGLSLSAVTERALAKNSRLLTDIVSARLFDEFVKTVKSGSCAKIFAEWRRIGAAQFIFTPLAKKNSFAEAVAKEADNRFKQGKEVSISFIIAAFFWKPIYEHFSMLVKEGEHVSSAMEKSLAYLPAVDMVPRKIVGRIQDLYFLQARMSAKPSKRRSSSIIRHPLFKRSVAFAAAQKEEKPQNIAAWWRDYSESDGEIRDKMIAQAVAASEK